MKIDEPYPAVILPPFQNTSVKDSLSASNFIMVGYGGDSEISKIEIDKLIEFAPKWTVFTMLLAIPEEKENIQLEKERELHSLKDNIKEIILRRREKALTKSNESYPEMKIWLQKKLGNLTGTEVDSLIIFKEKLLFSNSGIDKSISKVKVIKFKLDDPEKK
ncbi:hypothetical protein [Salegentibacter sp. Hel_I_6]|uniref:hypothetical protein n=1 Tax=Salegentibacter sp. Hel_I_6 TaxID=1250278 RepID=UPI0012E0B193|nr:hypothetical protein [Salegentibacter sp. Hel_I_6]